MTNVPVAQDDLSTLHQHCSTCYSFTRCTRDDDCCDFLSCPDRCYAVYHSCKGPEHYLLCPNVLVDCINSGLGCPAKLPRRETGPHLRACPASVVVCSAEWNRWPLYSTERRRQVGFRQKNPYAEEGQLDYDLVMRDQRMLNNLGKVSRKTRVSLRNNLTRRFPAVPLPESAFRPKDEDDREFQILDLGDDTEFSGIMMDDRMTRQMKRWQEDLDERLKDKVKLPKYWDSPELEKGNIHKEHCAYCYKSNCERGLTALQLLESCPEVTVGAAATSADLGNSCRLMSCRWNCGSVFHACKQFEHGIVCQLYEEADDFSWMYRGVGERGVRRTAENRHLSRAAVAAAADAAAKAMKPVESLFQGPGRPAAAAIPPATASRGGVISKIPAPPPMPKSVQNLCRLDIRIDTVTRLQTKPKSMYTFVCAQEFRRDEYDWHCKNVHNDIHGGLNNWVEHRCPMAANGCHFASRRFFPHDDRHNLIYSTMLESFGVTMKKESSSKVDVVAKAKKKNKSLHDLPTEILYYIFSTLDSFSLCNLAVTDKYFRSICCSLLEMKGCVTLQWERLRVNDKKFHWDIAHKRWFFSTAMKPIKKWTISTDAKVSNHLRHCPFNVKQEISELKRSKEWNELMANLKERYKNKRVH